MEESCHHKQFDSIGSLQNTDKRQSYHSQNGETAIKRTRGDMNVTVMLGCMDTSQYCESERKRWSCGFDSELYGSLWMHVMKEGNEK